MIAMFMILILAIYLVFIYDERSVKVEKEEQSAKYKMQMKKLWQVAQTSMKERKPFRAEKALLTILKFDEKNAAAYNRLGILYAKGKKYDEAVECFEIAQSLDSNPASIHNVGLIYLETGAYEKAEMAFRQAIELEGDVPSRYIALAKAEEKLGRPRKAIEALENAYELDPSVTTLRQTLAIYESMGDEAAIADTAARIEAQIAKDAAAKQRRRRVITRRSATESRAAATRGRAMRRRNASPTIIGGSTAKSKSSKSSSATGVKPISNQSADKTSAISGTKTRTTPRIIKPHAGRKRV